MRPSLSVLLFRVQFLLVTSRTSYFLMWHHCLLVLKQWEVSSLDLFTGTRQFQQRNPRLSQQLLTTKLKLVSLYFKVNVNLQKTTRSLEILNWQVFQWHHVAILRLRLPLILMLTVLWTSLLKTNQLVKHKISQSNLVEVFQMQISIEWLRRLKLLEKRTRLQKKIIDLKNEAD